MTFGVDSQVTFCGSPNELLTVLMDEGSVQIPIPIQQYQCWEFRKLRLRSLKEREEIWRSPPPHHFQKRHDPMTEL